MPTLQQLRYLVAVADTLHFRRAAERCHVTQPTLSGQLRELEERLGARLVERNRRSQIVLTPVGGEVAVRARSVLRDVAEIVELAQQDRGWLGRIVRLGAPPTLGPYLLPHMLPELHRRHPALKLYVREALPDALLAGIEDGALDLLLFPLPVRQADLVSEPLFQEPLWVVAPNDHTLAGRDAVAPADLRGETVLALERGHRLHDQIEELCRAYGAALSLDYEGTSLDTLRLMVGMGMGVSLLPALYVRSETPKDDLVVARRLLPEQPRRLVGLVWRRQAARGDEYRLLAALIRDLLRAGVPEVDVVG